MDRNYSTGLDLVRGLSAQMVLFGHSISLYGILTGLQPPNFPFIQNIGVVLFFFLSGVVITHVIAVQRPTYGRFLIDRTTRIYTALIPALIFVAIVDRYFDAHPAYAFYADKHSIGIFIGNILMFVSTEAHASFPWVPPFGTIRPVWSVVAEFWLYIFFGFIALYATVKTRLGLILAIALVAASIPWVFHTFVANLGGGLALVWLAGAAYYKIGIVGRTFQNRLALNAAALVLCFAFLFRSRYLAASAYDLRFSLMLCLTVVLAFEVYREITLPETFRTHVERVARFLASYSYSLYLVHMTVVFPIFVMCGNSASQTEKWIFLLSGLVAANVTSLAFWWLFESRYRDLRKIILSAPYRDAAKRATELR